MLATQKNTWLIDSLFLLLSIGIFYFILLGGHPLFVPDEGRYSEIAREMISSHDFITPRLNGVAFLDKPILYYWLQASAIYLFGLNEWALRFWPSILGIFGCLAAYLTGRKLFNRRTGLLTAALLATSPIYYASSHYANLDLEVAVLVSCALMSLVNGLHSESLRARSKWYWSAWIFCSLAFLTKGLIGIVFPMMVTGLWIISTWRWRVMKEMHLILGPIVFLVITMPWYYLVQKHNPEFFHYFFVTQQFSRFLSKTDFNNRVPVWFYLPIIFAGFLPWAVFAVQACIRAIRKSTRSLKKQTPILFLLLWFFAILIFFSIPTSKTIGYIIPTLPPLALLTAHYLDHLWERSARSLTIGMVILLPICWIGLPILTFAEWRSHMPITTWLLMITIMYLMVSVILLWFYQRKRPVYYSIFTLIASSIVFLLLFAGNAEKINKNSVKPMALDMQQTLKPTDEVVTYFSFYQDLMLYLQRRITVVADWNSPNIASSDNWVRELWSGMIFQDTHEWLISEKTFWQRWNSAKKIIVVIDEKRFAQFTNHIHKKFYHKKQYNDVIVVSNH